MTAPVDSFRLRRALALTAVRLESNEWIVSGGAAAHRCDARGTVCDCSDFRARAIRCKHLLAVALREGAPDVLAALAAMVALPTRVRRKVATP
jgi:hypothetical protein